MVENRRVTSPIVIGSEKTPLLGDMTLELLRLQVNPVTGKLKSRNSCGYSFILMLSCMEQGGIQNIMGEESIPGIFLLALAALGKRALTKQRVADPKGAIHITVLVSASSRRAIVAGRETVAENEPGYYVRKSVILLLVITLS